MKNKQRTIKNVVMILVAAGMIAALLFTTGIIRTGGHNGKQMGTPPGQSTSTSQSSDSGSSGSASGSTDSSSASGSTDSGSSSSSSSTSGSTDSGSSSSPDSAQQSGQPPTPPSGDSSGNQQGGPGGQRGPGGNGRMGGMNATKIALTAAESIVLALIIIYLILSGFNRKSLKETLPDRKKMAILILTTIVAGGAITAAGTFLPMKLMGGPGGMPGQSQNGQSGSDANASTVTASGATTVDSETKTLTSTYKSTEADQNAVLVTNSGSATLDGATVNKKSGAGSNTDNSDFYGINAAVLVNNQSAATIKNATIKTAADKSNAVFVTGNGSVATVSNTTITTTGKSSARGLDATYGGTIKANKVTVKTSGASSASLATDRGQGTVTATNSKLSTSGQGSPLIYSTGKISVSKTTGNASGSQITVVEGKNSATVSNSKLSASGTGNRGDVDVAGVMIYQSMSGDADEGTGSFTAKNSTLSINEDSNYYDSAPMFFVTNTDAKINLTNTKLNYGSGTLLSVKGTSEWGTEGKNGGDVTLTASKQTLKGNIELDSISTLKMSLTDGSSFTGSINKDQKAKSVKLTLSKDSKIKLTADTYVTSLEDADSSYSNIDLNGHTLYVNGKALKK